MYHHFNPIFLALLFGGAIAQDLPEPVPNQAKPGPKFAFTTVQNLPPGGNGWIPLKAVVIDNLGFSWIDADAEVRSDKNAEATGVEIKRIEAGFALIISVEHRWKRIPRDNIKHPCVPCISWVDAAPVPSLSTDGSAPEPKGVNKTKGGTQ